MSLNVKGLNYKALNEALRKNISDIILEECCGQRFIAAGMSDKTSPLTECPEMPSVLILTVHISP